MPRICVPVGIACLGAAAAFAVPAHAADTRCDHRFGAVSIQDDVIVPPGATCRLAGTRISGDVTVRPGGTLLVWGARITGDLEARRHARITVAPRGRAATRVHGDVLLARGRRTTVARAVVSGDVVLVGSRGRATITGNVVTGMLRCRLNVPAPVGGGNRVEGGGTGQCVGLTIAPSGPR